MSSDHVFLLTADGLRYDRLSCAGYDVATTPRLDAIADAGAACSQAMVTGTGTRKSFPGILTSSYPLMYGGYAQLTEHRTPLSSVFQSRGYTTLGINANAQLHSRFGWGRGFDVYFDSEQTVIDTPRGAFDTAADTGAANSPLRRRFDSLKSTVYERLDQDGWVYQALESAYRRVERRAPPHPTADDIVDRTLSFVDKAPDDRPLFVWVHFMDTHSPYVPPAEYRAAVDAPEVSDRRLWRLNDHLHTNPGQLSDDDVAIISAMYDASLRFFDAELGRLIDGLADRGLWEDARVAFTSDHGEEFREHGGLTHCTEPYEEGAHVPLLFKFGADSLDDLDAVVSTIDIGPTLLDATFDDPAVPERFHGRSLVPALRGTGDIPDDRTVFIQNANRGGRDVDLSTRITGCRTAEWKFITSRDESLSIKLFHLPADPGEQENVAADHPSVVSDFTALVDEHYTQDAYTLYEIEGAVGTGQVSDRLEALGYVQE
jgi:arylsulfatase A-like enzyme